MEQQAAGLADGEGFDDALAFDFDPLALLAFALGADASLLFADLDSPLLALGVAPLARGFFPRSGLFLLRLFVFVLVLVLLLIGARTRRAAAPFGGDTIAEHVVAGERRRRGRLPPRRSASRSRESKSSSCL